MPQSCWATIYKEAQAKYLDVFKSILQNPLMPILLIKTFFPGTDNAISFAHIPANQILNHCLALGYECYFHHAGFDEGWIEHQNASSSLLMMMFLIVSFSKMLTEMLRRL